MNDVAPNAGPAHNITLLRRFAYAIIGILLALIIGIAIGEWLGWPFLAEPLQRIISEKLDRRVTFSAGTSALSASALSTNSTNASSTNISPTNTTKAAINNFQIRFIGGLRLHTAQLEIAAPVWSKAPYLLLAHDVELELRYIDLWRAYNAKPLIIKRLQASSLDSHLERLPDGSASWQFSKKTASQPVALPTFDYLLVTNGTLSYAEKSNASKALITDIKADFSLNNHVNNVSLAKTSSQSLPSENSGILQAKANGYFHQFPLKIILTSTGILPTNNHQTLPIGLTLNATVGRASLYFKGNAKDTLHLNDFEGTFKLKGPSMAAVGDLFGVTLPTTSEFSTSGNMSKHDATWRAKLNHLDLGASHLNGNFKYEKNDNLPMLSGNLGGTKFLLTDLGPAFGASPSSTKRSKVLPDKPFDLKALRVMDADVLINIDYVDLKSSFLEQLRPFRGHLKLSAGVLTLTDIDTRSAQGKLKGNLSLDGRQAKAILNTNLAWENVKLEQWVKQVRDKGLPPYVSGRLNGQAILKGQGKSTAEILASLTGNVRSQLRDGAVSHFAIELAGLDVAQSMGVLFEGDDALPVQCAVVDLQADNGIFRPRVMVLDTKDSAVWVDGSLSLATEELNLRAMVMPKDFSPLTLRAPLDITGTFAKPNVSLEKKPIGIKLAASAFLAILNPLAAIIPLFDTGDTKQANLRAASCKSLMQFKSVDSSIKTIKK